MRIQIPNNGSTTTILLKDVLYAPDMGLTIISISRVAAAGYSALFRANFCRIFDSKQSRIGQIHVTPNGLYRVDHEESVSAAGTKEKVARITDPVLYPKVKSHALHMKLYNSWCQ